MRRLQNVCVVVAVSVSNVWIAMNNLICWVCIQQTTKLFQRATDKIRQKHQQQDDGRQNISGQYIRPEDIVKEIRLLHGVEDDSSTTRQQSVDSSSNDEIDPNSTVVPASAATETSSSLSSSSSSVAAAGGSTATTVASKNGHSNPQNPLSIIGPNFLFCAKTTEQDSNKFWKEKFHYDSPFQVFCMSFFEARKPPPSTESVEHSERSNGDENTDEKQSVEASWQAYHDEIWIHILSANVLEGISWSLEEKAWKSKISRLKRNTEAAFLETPERLSMVETAPGLHGCHWKQTRFGDPPNGGVANFYVVFCLARLHFVENSDVLQMILRNLDALVGTATSASYTTRDNNDSIPNDGTGLELVTTDLDLFNDDPLQTFWITGTSLLKHNGLLSRCQDNRIINNNNIIDDDMKTKNQNRSLFWEHKQNTGNACLVFVSHQWLESHHPDPERADLVLLQKMVTQLVTLCMKVISTLLYLGFTHDQILFVGQDFPLANTRIALGGTIASDMVSRVFHISVLCIPENLASKIPSFSSENKEMIESYLERWGKEWFDSIVAKIYFWVDYSCIPQRPRDLDEDALFKKTLTYLRRLQQAACTLAISSMTSTTYINRAWCYVEYVFAEECSKIDHENSRPDISTDSHDKLRHQSKCCASFLALTAMEPQNVLQELDLKITNGKEDSSAVCSLMWEGVQGLFSDTSKDWYKVAENKCLTFVRTHKEDVLDLLRQLINGEFVSLERWMHRKICGDNVELDKNVILFLHYDETPSSKECWEALHKVVSACVENDRDIVALSIADKAHGIYQEVQKEHSTTCTPDGNKLVTVSFGDTMLPFGCTTHIIPRKLHTLPPPPPLFPAFAGNIR